MTIQLRPDQWKLDYDIEAAWNAGAQNVMAVLPTGGGKSIIVANKVATKSALGAQSCVIAHRKELVGQMSLHVARRGVRHRIIGPNDVVAQIIRSHREEFNGASFINPTAHCAVAGIDTLNARGDDLAQWASQIDYWFGDEGHHFLLDNKWGRGIKLFTRARGLLVTATPTRADGKGLGRHADGVADAMACGPTMRELIDIGALTDYEIAIPESDFQIDENDLPPSGDFTPRKMREASKKSHIVGDVVVEYSRRAYGKRAICFATDVETAGEIAQRFNDAGIPSASVSAETPTEVRDSFVKKFRDGRLWVLVNVDLFGEGFDVPACEVVIMARPTASLAVYLQQFGRALRPMLGKLFGLIIDHVSNYKRHGLPDKPHYWTLDRREKRGKRERDPEEIELTPCKNCSRPMERIALVCPACGHPVEVTPQQRMSIEQIDGDLMLLDRAKLEEMRKAIMLPSPAAVGTAAHAVAGRAAGAGAVNRQIERIQMQQRLQAAIDQWAGIQRARGRPDQETYRRFYVTTGIDTMTALTLPRVDMEKLAERVEGWFSNGA
jgi:DNA repair protein RadD